MFKKTLISLAVASSVGLTGCWSSGDEGANANPEYSISNPDFTGGTWPAFNALAQEFPVPNDILTLSAEVQDGTMVDGSDPENPVTTGIGFLDGNSTTAAFDIKISGSLDPNQELDARSFIEANGSIIPNPNQNVFLLPLTFPSGDPLLQAEGEIPSFKDAITYKTGVTLAGSSDTTLQAQGAALLQSLAAPVARAEVISLDDGQNNFLRINPVRPLAPKTKYLVVITNRVVDAEGDPLIASPSYQNYRNPDEPLGSDLLEDVRSAVLSWEQLASGYFGFMRDVFAQAGLPESAAPTQDDIVMSITFTTTAIDDVLKANAAPRTFLSSKAEMDAKQSAIKNLNSGVFNVTGQAIEGADTTTQAINNRIYELLTDPTAAFSLFNAELAQTLTQANAAGISLSFNDVVVGSDGTVNTTLAFALQSAAAQAALDTVVVAEPTTTIADVIAAEAATTADNLIAAGILEAPAARPVSMLAANSADQYYAALPATAMIAEGEITLPYYQGIPDPAASPEANIAALQGYSWKANSSEQVTAPSDKVTYRFPFAQPTGDVTVPVTVTYPAEALNSFKPDTGWPVIIFQHGINTDRSASLPMASAMANACVQMTDTGPAPTGLDCYATVSIDQPLHGISPNGSILTLAEVPGPGLTPIDELEGASPEATERHFYYAADPATNLATPMSMLPAEAQTSGSLFINLANFANSRDNLRQGVLDLLNLNASLGNVDDALDAVDGAEDTDLDLNRIYFMGHSLGTINGTPFVAVNNAAHDAVAGSGGTPALPKVKASAMLMGGGMVTKLLENSETIAPRILQGLASASDGQLVQGTSALEIYFSVLQGLVDNADPINYGGTLGNRALFTVAVGDDTIPNEADKNPLDLTLPNGFVIDSLSAPLAGTEPVIEEFGATVDGRLQVVRYTDGEHSTPVSADPQPVFQDIVVKSATMFTESEPE